MVSHGVLRPAPKTPAKNPLNNWDTALEDSCWSKFNACLCEWVDEWVDEWVSEWVHDIINICFKKW